MLRRLALSFLCLFFYSPFSWCSQGAHPGDEIKIYLSTASSLTPLYLSDVHVQKGEFDTPYLVKLREILLFDLEHDGYSGIIPKQAEKEELLHSNDKQKAFDQATWKAWGAAHVVRTKLAGRTLSLEVFSVQGRLLRHLPPIHLSGNLNTDRRQIHQLADILYKLLYDVEGVANSRILFCLQTPSKTGSRNKWVSEVWECDIDGANLRQVTHENSYCVTPVFLPSGGHYGSDRFVYVSYKQGQPKIYIASLKEGIGKKLVDLRGNQLLPAISSQRDKIAFICDASGRTDLFVQHLNPLSGRADMPRQLFSYPRSTQASPTFSPDGNTIAFVSDKDGSAKIYTLPAQTGTKRAVPQLLTKKNSENSCPAWSPDGTKIAYSAKTKGVRQIWIYDFATGEERQLTDGPGHKENPAWAPNSLHIVFNSTGGENSELYLVNLHQPEVIQITSGPGKKDYPAWSSR